VEISGITWHTLALEPAAFHAMQNLLTETFGLTPAVQEEGFTMFPMPNGTVLELYTPSAVPGFGFNNGIAFGFRVGDLESASAELAAAGVELLDEIVRMPEIGYAYRHFRGPDGRVYGLNEKKPRPRRP